MVAPAVAPFLQLPNDPQLAAKHVAARFTGSRDIITPGTGWSFNILVPTIGHYATYAARQKLDAKLGHTRALARRSLTAWATELGDGAIATGGKIPTTEDEWKKAYYGYVQTQSGYAPGGHLWFGYGEGRPSFKFDGPAAQKFFASTGLHIGAFLVRKTMSHFGLSRYLRMGGKSLVTA